MLGRTGQVGGPVRVRSRIDRGGRTLLLEDQHFDPVGRRRPGLLGAERVVDSLLAVGPGLAPAASTARASGGAAAYALPNGGGTLVRFLGRELADSPVGAEWRRLTGGTA